MRWLQTNCQLRDQVASLESRVEFFEDILHTREVAYQALKETLYAVSDLRLTIVEPKVSASDSIEFQKLVDEFVERRAAAYGLTQQKLDAQEALIESRQEGAGK